MITACARLLRGSGYVAFDGEVPADPVHAALASEYAHVTAPLRRLGDRYAGEICVALCAGTDVPSWVSTKLADLPEIMKDAGRRAAQYEAMVLDLVEAGILHRHVGETYEGVVTDVDHKDETRGKIIIQEPAVEARVTSSSALPLGTEVEVRLAQADLASRSVSFQIT
jgi:exoribonuclease R